MRTDLFRPMMVVTFCIDTHEQEVLLVKKVKPSWQRNLYNGIGGKVEPGESSWRAAIREFNEEARYDGSSNVPWRRFAVETWKDYELHAFALYSTEMPGFINWRYDDLVKNKFNDAGEELYWYSLDAIHEADDVIGNLKWMLPLARDPRAPFAAVSTSADIKEMPTW